MRAVSKQNKYGGIIMFKLYTTAEQFYHDNPSLKLPASTPNAEKYARDAAKHFRKMGLLVMLLYNDTVLNWIE
jgi:fructose-1,6-bisphosphatase